MQWTNSFGFIASTLKVRGQAFPDVVFFLDTLLAGQVAEIVLQCH